MKQIERHQKIVGREELIRIAEEIVLAGMLCAFERRGGRGDLAAFEVSQNFGADVQKRVLADNRVIALEHVLMVGIELAAEGVGIIVQRRMVEAVTIPLRHADSPTIFDRDKVAAGLPSRGITLEGPVKPNGASIGSVNNSCGSSGTSAGIPGGTFSAGERK